MDGRHTFGFTFEGSINGRSSERDFPSILRNRDCLLCDFVPSLSLSVLPACACAIFDLLVPPDEPRFFLEPFKRALRDGIFTIALQHPAVDE